MRIANQHSFLSALGLLGFESEIAILDSGVGISKVSDVFARSMAGLHHMTVGDDSSTPYGIDVTPNNYLPAIRSAISSVLSPVRGQINFGGTSGLQHVCCESNFDVTIMSNHDTRPRPFGYIIADGTDWTYIVEVAPAYLVDPTSACIPFVPLEIITLPKGYTAPESGLRSGSQDDTNTSSFSAYYKMLAANVIVSVTVVSEASSHGWAQIAVDTIYRSSGINFKKYSTCYIPLPTIDSVLHVTTDHGAAYSSAGSAFTDLGSNPNLVVAEIHDTPSQIGEQIHLFLHGQRYVSDFVTISRRIQSPVVRATSRSSSEKLAMAYLIGNRLASTVTQ